MLCGLIMAGGKGTRFWPLSTEEKPKQFLNLVGEDTMLQMTVKRLEKLIPTERIFIVTADRYVNLVNEQLPGLPARNIIVEPEGRNTAPCIALSAFIIEKYYGDAELAVVPSDHLINDEEKFIETLKVADEFVNSNDNSIVTLGIKPDRSETGYGYIKFSGTKDKINDLNINMVEGFVEKPNYLKAQEYINEGTYLWNSGMFIWKTSTIKKYTKSYLLETYTAVYEIAAAIDTKNYKEILRDKYSNVESISVDYGIMEKAENIYVIPSDFGWDDVGNWSSIERYREKDKQNNILLGRIKSLKCKNNLVIGNGKEIALVGIDDIFVIDTKDILLIGKKEHLENINEIQKQIG